jgi:hypothetical protein
VNPHPRPTDRKTGTPTTNPISRAPKRKNRAAERMFTSGVFDSSPLNLFFDFDLPSSRQREGRRHQHENEGGRHREERITIAKDGEKKPTEKEPNALQSR